MFEILSMFVCEFVCVFVVPVVIRKAWPPVGRPEEGLEGTGQVHKQVTHQEEPKRQIIRTEAH